LCLFDAVGESFGDQLDAFLTDPLNHRDLGWKRPPGPAVIAFARELAAGAWQYRLRADQLLSEHVPDWSVRRMQPVDRNILRLGLYELLASRQTPYQVVLNEAIELARRFGGADSPGFVNGVLDGVRRKVAAQVDGFQPTPVQSAAACEVESNPKPVPDPTVSGPPKED